MLYWNLCLSLEYQMKHIVKRRSLAVVSDFCKKLQERTQEYVSYFCQIRKFCYPGTK